MSPRRKPRATSRNPTLVSSPRRRTPETVLRTLGKSPTPSGGPLDLSKVKDFQAKTHETFPTPGRNPPTQPAIDQPSEYYDRKAIKGLFDEIDRFCQEVSFNYLLQSAGCKGHERPWHRLADNDINNHHFFYVYEYLLTKLGIKFPISPFYCFVLTSINAAPIQLHPNAWAFMRCFEILCDAIQLPPSLVHFFYLYDVDRKSLQSRGWVALKVRPGRSRLNPFKRNPKATFARIYFKIGVHHEYLELFTSRDRSIRFPLLLDRGVY